VLFGDETSMSASIIVVVASAFAFADSSPLAGPLLIGSLGGFYLPHFRRGSLSLIVANATSLGLTALTTANATTVLADHTGGSVPPMPLAILGVMTYWSINSVLIGTASALRQGMSLRRSIEAQITSEWPLLLLVAAVAQVSLASPGSIPTAILAVVVGIAAFEFRMRTDSGFLGDLVGTSSWCVAAAIGLSATLAVSQPNGASIGLVCCYLLAVSTFESRSSATALTTSILAALVTAYLLHFLGTPAEVSFLPTTLAALGSAVGVKAVQARHEKYVQLPVLVLVGLLVPGYRDGTILAVGAASVLALGRLSGPASLLLMAATTTVLLTCTRANQGLFLQRAKITDPRSLRNASR
ncbi:MAG: hypothetical protein ACKOA9_05330, partial [Actinomycetota bacterium]